MIILGIETSCDETAAAVVDVNDQGYIVLSSIVASQAELHNQFGGVVPEVAARAHVPAMIPTINAAIAQAKIAPNQLDLMAVTRGPGLMTALLVGVQTAKTLAWAWHKPLVGINHLLGHLFTAAHQQQLRFPALSLIVSGGHTELVLSESFGNHKVIGRTIDDAAGEAFDKVAKMLHLGYPGGPAISKLATLGNPKAINFPRPLLHQPHFDFSFAGLKTAVLYYVRDHVAQTQDQQGLADIAAGFQQAVVDVLVAKTMKAATHSHAQTISISGGVAANTLLRQTMMAATTAQGLDLLTVEPQLNTDNAVMAAVAGYFEWRSGPHANNLTTVDPNLNIG